MNEIGPTMYSERYSSKQRKEMVEEPTVVVYQTAYGMRSSLGAFISFHIMIIIIMNSVYLNTRKLSKRVLSWPKLAKLWLFTVLAFWGFILMMFIGQLSL